MYTKNQFVLSGGHLGSVPRTWVYIWSAILQVTTNMGPPKRLFITHWKALGESS